MALHGFVELICEHAGILRGGPECHAYGDKFEMAVAFAIKGNKAIIKGLVSPDSKFSREYYDLGCRLLAGIGLEPQWERYRDHPQ